MNVSNKVKPRAMKVIIAALFVCFACASDIARSEHSHPGEESVGPHLTLHFQSFAIHIYPIPKLRGSGMSQQTDNAGWIYCWGDIDRSICVQGRSIVLDDVHYKVSPECAEIWLINGKLISPDSGIIAPSPQPKDMADAVAEQKDDFRRIVGDVEFEIEQGDSSGTGEVRNGSLVWAKIGELFFGVLNGSLIFRGKDCGKVGKGDIVKVDKARKVTIVKNAASSASPSQDPTKGKASPAGRGNSPDKSRPTPRQPSQGVDPNSAPK